MGGLFQPPLIPTSFTQLLSVLLDSPLSFTQTWTMVLTLPVHPVAPLCPSPAQDQPPPSSWPHLSHLSSFQRETQTVSSRASAEGGPRLSVALGANPERVCFRGEGPAYRPVPPPTPAMLSSTHTRCDPRLMSRWGSPLRTPPPSCQPLQAWPCHSLSVSAAPISAAQLSLTLLLLSYLRPVQQQVPLAFSRPPPPPHHGHQPEPGALSPGSLPRPHRRPSIHAAPLLLPSKPSKAPLVTQPKAKPHCGPLGPHRPLGVMSLLAPSWAWSPSLPPFGCLPPDVCAACFRRPPLRLPWGPPPTVLATVV